MPWCSNSREQARVQATCPRCILLVRFRNPQARALSPRAAIAAAGGPRNRMDDAVSARAAGSSGFSDAWPLPCSTAAIVLNKS